MRKFITTVTAAALLAVSTASPAPASAGQRHHGFRSGPAYHAGSYSNHRSDYRYRYRRHSGYWRPYFRGSPGHYRRYRHGGYYYFSGDAAVVLGVLAGAVVLGSLLSQPAPAPARPAVLRSPSGVPLGGCLRTTGTGTWYGRPARFSGTMCYDPAGRAYVLPGSERFVGYLR
jgi:hypothetical protein